MEKTVRLMAIVALLLAMMPGAPALAAGVGFQKVDIPNGAEPPLTAGIWYPTDAPATPHALGDVTQTVAADAPIAGHHLPLIVLSHGGGGWYGAHYDTALALARAGFVAAAASHAGDTFDDQSRVLQLWRRPAQLHRLVIVISRIPGTTSRCGTTCPALPTIAWWQTPATTTFCHLAMRVLRGCARRSATARRGFDRTAFHQRFNAAVVRSFESMLRWERDSPEFVVLRQLVSDRIPRCL
ncbi:MULTISPECIES: hypothetical protein [Paraburkholderia]|uniref:hypothetical protein n=1 Tax=Paraburkholderia TaxID=1822464 RepID=UPI001EF75D05|nr:MULTISPECIES: hypothetical protein [Paraburkholderia]MDH6148052.1 putative dienelactone hydrolase [Paraburkholderia sp. WSM4179]